MTKYLHVKMIINKCNMNISRCISINLVPFSKLSYNVSERFFWTTLECRIKEKYDESETGYYLVAEIINILVDEKYLAEDGNPDMEKMELIVFDPIHHGYIQLGEKVGNAFSDGKALK